MYGDFTRFGLDPQDPLAGVWMQRGGGIDADWNLRFALARARDAELRRDLGVYGAPQGSTDFAIAPTEDRQDLAIAPGRLYLDSLVCAHDGRTTMLGQPKAWVTYGTLSVVYLEAWERTLSPLEGPGIADSAADPRVPPAVRSRVEWRVQAEPLPRQPTTQELQNLAAIAAREVPAAGPGWRPGGARPEPARLTAAIEGDVRADALFRVEAHGRIASEYVPTLKWSADNGRTVAVAAEGGVGLAGVMLQTPVDAFPLGQRPFERDAWIEVTDEVSRTSGEPGSLGRIEEAEGNFLRVKWINDDVEGQVEEGTWQGVVLVRQWDGLIDAAHGVDGEAFARDRAFEARLPQLGAGTGGTLTPRGAAVRIRVTAGAADSGSYWLIPVRRAENNVLWPTDEDGPRALAPAGGHEFAPLALVARDGIGFGRLRAADGAEDAEPLEIPVLDLRPRFVRASAVEGEVAALRSKLSELQDEIARIARRRGGLVP